jgi:hypothetical protein
MGKKKAVIGNTIEIDLPVVEPPAEPVVKKKREITDKQRENLAKGMAILKMKRENKSKKDAEEKEVVEPVVTPPVVPVVPVAPPAPVVQPVVKERKPRVVKNYLTTEDFNSFKNELLGSLKNNDTVKPSEPMIPAPQVVLQPQLIKEIVKERVITGREMLDRIFFK